MTLLHVVSYLGSYATNNTNMTTVRTSEATATLALLNVGPETLCANRFSNHSFWNVELFKDLKQHGTWEQSLWSSVCIQMITTSTILHEICCTFKQREMHQTNFT